MIAFSHVTKRYGSVAAVNDLSFTVPEGQVVGLLGQNGAGKTTTLNILTGYLAPSEGKVTIAGFDLLTEPRSARQHVGYLPEIPPLYDEMTVEGYLKFVSDLRMVVRSDIKEHVRDVAEKTGLKDVLGRRIGNLSKGYRQRVGLAQALCGDPRVLILDEPTVGLDPRQTAELRETLKKIAKNRTVIFSSHILSEVQSLCDRVLILHHGKIVYDHEAGKMPDATKLNARILGDEKTLLPALRSLKHVNRVIRLAPQEEGAVDVTLECSALRPAQKELHTLLSALSMPLLRLVPVNETLEEVFLRCTQGG
ncbi:MAG: ABC transporter ATP-binding protein [Clostridia bacterium]|nr:ABC transporter ATP-binding protein [Clostridia bacterium]